MQGLVIIYNNLILFESSPKGWLLQNLVMLIIAVLYALVVLYFVKLHLRIRLNRCRTLSEANAVRESYGIKFFLVLLGVALTAPFIIPLAILYWNHSLHLSTFIYSVLCAFFIIVPFLFVFVHKSPNVQTLSFADVYQKKTPYILLLRAFVKDDYVASSTFGGHNWFSEVSYTQALRQNVPNVFAVGNPRRLTSPMGAQRVFLDMEGCQWMRQAAALMKEAREIHIIVSATESCIWEIREAMAFKEKVVMIVDNRKEYEKIRATFKDFPPIPDKRHKVYLLRFKDKGWLCSESGNLYHRKRLDRTRLLAWAYVMMWPLAFLVALPSPTEIATMEEASKAEYHQAYQWDCDKWIENLSGHCPITVGESSQVTECKIQDSLVVLTVQGPSRLCVADAEINEILDSLFIVNPDVEKYFYEKIFATYNTINLSFIDGDILLSEEDIIRLGRLKRHIKEHQSLEERLNEYYETMPFIIID